MEFARHPSQELNNLFEEKPYQGQSPEKAQVLFLSSDANYSPEISNHDFFRYIIEYQEDGISFWNKYDCHHPFLHPDFPFNKRSGGRPFHKNFSKIGLDKSYTEYISFIELLNIPTIGNKSSNKSRFYDLVSVDHLRHLENLILGGGHKLFFISGGVLRDIFLIKKQYRVFEWLDYSPSAKDQYSQTINGNKIREIYHFSAWQIHGQLIEIKTIIDDWLNRAL